MGVVRRYIDFFILLIPTPLVLALFGSSIPTLFILKMFFHFWIIIYLHELQFILYAFSLELDMISCKKIIINCQFYKNFSSNSLKYSDSFLFHYRNNFPFF